MRWRCKRHALPCREGLVEGHCCIVPSAHVASSRTVDDDTWTEMRNFKKSLILMARAQARLLLDGAAQRRDRVLVEAVWLHGDLGGLSASVAHPGRHAGLHQWLAPRQAGHSRARLAGCPSRACAAQNGAPAWSHAPGRHAQPCAGGGRIAGRCEQLTGLSESG